MLGDGEIQEGQVWETIHVAPRYGAGNLTAILDWNGMQQYGWRLGAGEAHRGNRRDPWAGVDLRAVFEASAGGCSRSTATTWARSWRACEDGRVPASAGTVPTVILARTVRRGRGSRSPRAAPSGTPARPQPDEARAARAELARRGTEATP